MSIKPLKTFSHMQLVYLFNKARLLQQNTGIDFCQAVWILLPNHITTQLSKTQFDFSHSTDDIHAVDVCIYHVQDPDIPWNSDTFHAWNIGKIELPEILHYHKEDMDTYHNIKSYIQ